MRQRPAVRLRPPVARRIVVALALAAAGVAAQQRCIHTYAGGPGAVGDGGLARAAALVAPVDVVVDAETGATLYIAEAGSRRVRGVSLPLSASSTIQTVAGAYASPPTSTGDGGPARLATFLSVAAVAHGAGVQTQLYIADEAGHVVRAVVGIVGGGVIYRLAGSGSSGHTDGSLASSVLSGPRGLAVSQSGRFVFVSCADNRIKMIDVVGSNITTLLQSGTGESAKWPRFLAAGAGFVDVIFADSFNQQLRTLTMAGAAAVIAGIGVNNASNLVMDGGSAAALPLNTPIGVAYDQATGQLAFTEGDRPRVRLMGSLAATSQIYTLAGSGTEPLPPGTSYTVAASRTALSAVSGLAFDSSSNLYVAHVGGNTVEVITPQGAMMRVAGVGGNSGAGDVPGMLAASNVALGRPYGASSPDARGRLYVAEYYFRVRRINSDGTATTVVGDGVLGNGLPYGPGASMRTGIATHAVLENTTSLLWGDDGNCAVKRLNIDTNVVTPAFGVVGLCGYTCDLCPASTAYLNAPSNLAPRASDGAWFIADDGNHRIRIVYANGTIDTYVGRSVGGFNGDGWHRTNTSLTNPNGMAWEGSFWGLIIVDSGNLRIRRVAPTSNTVTTIMGNGGATYGGDGPFPHTRGMGIARQAAFDSRRWLYIVESGSHAIRLLFQNMTVVTLVGSAGVGFGGDGGPPQAALLNNPRSIAFDVRDNAYITDADNNALRIVSSGSCGPAIEAAIVTTLTSAAFADSVGLDLTGNLLIGCTSITMNGRPCTFTGVRNVTLLQVRCPLTPWNVSTLAVSTWTITGQFWGYITRTLSLSAISLSRRSFVVSPSSVTLGGTVMLIASAFGWAPVSSIAIYADAAPTVAKVLAPCVSLTYVDSNTWLCKVAWVPDEWLTGGTLRLPLVLRFMFLFSDGSTRSSPPASTASLTVLNAMPVLPPTCILPAGGGGTMDIRLPAPLPSDAVLVAASALAAAVAPWPVFPLAAACAANQYRVWLGTTLLPPAACNYSVVLNVGILQCSGLPGGSALLWRVTVEACGGWNVTSDGNAPDAELDPSLIVVNAYCSFNPASAHFPVPAASQPMNQLRRPTTTITIAGVALLTLAPYLEAVYVGGVPCPSILIPTNTQLMCVAWPYSVVPETAGSAVGTALASLPITITFRGTNLTAEGTSVRAVHPPSVAAILPQYLSSFPATFAIVGKGLLALAPSSPAATFATTNTTVTIAGNASLCSVVSFTDTSIVCRLSTPPPQTLPNYPALAVIVATAASGATTSPLNVSVPIAPSATWLSTRVAAPGAVLTPPAGNSPAALTGAWRTDAGVTGRLAPLYLLPSGSSLATAFTMPPLLVSAQGTERVTVSLRVADTRCATFDVERRAEPAIRALLNAANATLAYMWPAPLPSGAASSDATASTWQLAGSGVTVRDTMIAYPGAAAVISLSAGVRGLPGCVASVTAEVTDSLNAVATTPPIAVAMAPLRLEWAASYGLGTATPALLVRGVLPDGAMALVWPPARLPPLTALFTLPGNVSLPYTPATTAADAAQRWLSCTASLAANGSNGASYDPATVPALATWPVADPISATAAPAWVLSVSSGALAVSSAATAAAMTNALASAPAGGSVGNATLNATFAGVQAGSAGLGALLGVEAECSWLASGDRWRLPPLAVLTPAAAVAMNLSTMGAGGVRSAASAIVPGYQILAVPATIVLAPGAAAVATLALATSSPIACSIRSVNVSGPSVRLATATLEAVTLVPPANFTVMSAAAAGAAATSAALLPAALARPGVAVASIIIPVEVQGASGDIVFAALQCTVHGYVVTSAPVRLQVGAFTASLAVDVPTAGSPMAAVMTPITEATPPFPLWPSGTLSHHLFPATPSLVVTIAAKDAVSCTVIRTAFICGSRRARGVGSAGYMAASYGEGYYLSPAAVPQSALVGTLAADLTNVPTSGPATLLLMGVGVKAAGGCGVNATVVCRDGVGRSATTVAATLLATLLRAEWCDNVTVTLPSRPRLPGVLPPLSVRVFAEGGWPLRPALIAAAAVAAASPMVSCDAAVLSQDAELPWDRGLPEIVSMAPSTSIAAVATATAVASADSMDRQDLQLNFTEVDLYRATLGARLMVVAECVWEPTGERLRLPPINITVATLALTVRQPAPPTLPAYDWTPLPAALLIADMEPAAVDADAASVAAVVSTTAGGSRTLCGRCQLMEVVGSATTALLAVTPAALSPTTSYLVDATPIAVSGAPGTSALNLTASSSNAAVSAAAGAGGILAVGLQGPPLQSLRVRLRCVMWAGQEVVSNEVTLSTLPYAVTLGGADGGVLSSLPSAVPPAGQMAAVTQLLFPLAPAPLVSAPAVGALTCVVSVAASTCPPYAATASAPPAFEAGPGATSELQAVNGVGIGHGSGLTAMTLVGTTEYSVEVASPTQAAAVAMSTVGLCGGSGCSGTLVTSCRDATGRANLTTGGGLRVTLPTLAARYEPPRTAADLAVLTDAIPGPLPPLPLRLWARGANLTLTIAAADAAGYTASPAWTCTSQLIRVAGGAPLSTATITVGAAVGRGVDGVTGEPWWDVVVPPVTAATAELGATLQLSTQCLWLASGEVVPLPPLRVTIISFSVALRTLPASELAGIGTTPAGIAAAAAFIAVADGAAPSIVARPIPVLGYVTVPTGFALAASSTANLLEGGVRVPGGITCAWALVNSTLRAALATSAIVTATSGGPLALGSLQAAPLRIEAASGAVAFLTFTCVAFGGKVVQGPVLGVRLSSLVVSPGAPLPTRFYPSDASNPFAVTPRVVVVVQHQGPADGAYDELPPLGDVDCAVTTTTPGVVLTAVNGDAATLANVRATVAGGPAGGYEVALPPFGVQATFAVPLVMVRVTCTRDSGDQAPALTFPLDLTELRMRTCSPPVMLTASQVKLPRFAFAVTETCGGGTPPSQLPPIACKIALSGKYAALAAANASLVAALAAPTGYAAAAAANGSGVVEGVTETDAGSIFLAGAITVVDVATGVATFADFALTAPQGSLYILHASCAIGSVPIPPAIPFLLELQGCPPGQMAVSVFCARCPGNQYSLGGVNAQCTRCPPSGVRCDDGILALLPNYYRPPKQRDLPFVETTELHPCANGEACVVNGSTLSYSCAGGYVGPLCGVCDLEGGFARYGDACRPCWTAASNWGFLSLLMLIVFALLCFVALRKSDGQRSQASIALRITMSYLQAVGSLKAFRAGGTKAYRDLMGWTDAVSASPLSIGSLQCLWRPPYLLQLATTVAIPLLAVAAVITIFILATALRSLGCRGNRVLFRKRLFRGALAAWLSERRHVATLVFVLFLAYMAVTSASLRALDCHTPIDGVRYLNTDLRVQCYVGEHAAALFIAYTVLVLFGLGFPLGLFWMIATAPLARLAHPTFMAAWGFAFAGYRATRSAADVAARMGVGLADTANGSATSPSDDAADATPLTSLHRDGDKTGAAGATGAADVAVAGGAPALATSPSQRRLQRGAASRRRSMLQVAVDTDPYGALQQAAVAAAVRAAEAEVASEAAADAGEASASAASPVAAVGSLGVATAAPAAISSVARLRACWRGAVSFAVRQQRRVTAEHLMWWESVVLLRKAGIVLLATLVTNAHVQTAGAALWLIAALLLQLRHAPYAAAWFNLLEAWSLTAAVATAIIAGSLLQYDVTDPAFLSQAPAAMKPLEWAITIALVTINLATLALLAGTWAWLQFQRLRTTVSGLRAKVVQARASRAAADAARQAWRHQQNTELAFHLALRRQLAALAGGEGGETAGGGKSDDTAAMPLAGYGYGRRRATFAATAALAEAPPTHAARDGGSGAAHPRLPSNPLRLAQLARSSAIFSTGEAPSLGDSGNVSTRALQVNPLLLRRGGPATPSPGQGGGTSPASAASPRLPTLFPLAARFSAAMRAISPRSPSSATAAASPSSASRVPHSPFGFADDDGGGSGGSGSALLDTHPSAPMVRSMRSRSGVRGIMPSPLPLTGVSRSPLGSAASSSAGSHRASRAPSVASPLGSRRSSTAGTVTPIAMARSRTASLTRSSTVAGDAGAAEVIASSGEGGLAQMESVGDGSGSHGSDASRDASSGGGGGDSGGAASSDSGTGIVLARVRSIDSGRGSMLPPPRVLSRTSIPAPSSPPPSGVAAKPGNGVERRGSRQSARRSSSLGAGLGGGTVVAVRWRGGDGDHDAMRDDRLRPEAMADAHAAAAATMPVRAAAFDGGGGARGGAGVRASVVAVRFAPSGRAAGAGGGISATRGGRPAR